MCCFKRLAVRIKRKAGWARKERPTSVSRPSDDQIKHQKNSARQGKDRNERRKSARAKREESERRMELFRQKGWAT